MRWFSLFSFLLLLVACQKETIQLDVVEIESQTSQDINDLFFVNENVAYYCGGQLWESGVVGKSTDGGQTWEIVLEADNILFGVAFKNENEGVAFGFSGRVWSTSDGGDTWSLKENNPDYPVFSDAQFITDNLLILAAGFSYNNGGFAAYSYNGQTFSDSLIGQDMQAVHFFDERKGVIAGYGSLYTTKSGGESWEANALKGDYFRDLAFNTRGEGLVVGYQGKIFHSEDDGANWEKNSSKSRFFTTKGNLESVAIQNNQAFITGQNASLFYTENFLDGDWSRVEVPLEGDFLKVYLKNSSQGFVAGTNGLLFSFSY